MQPFNWSDAELQQSTPTDHDKVRRRYSLDNENFDFHSPQEIFWKLEEQERFEEGLVYFAADFALVQPDCFEQVDEFLDDLEMQYFEKSEEARQVYFKDADETETPAMRAEGRLGFQQGVAVFGAFIRRVLAEDIFIAGRFAVSAHFVKGQPEQRIEPMQRHQHA